MKNRRQALLVVSILTCAVIDVQAGRLVFQLRPADGGEPIPIESKADIDKNLPAECSDSRTILEGYFSNSTDMQEIRSRVGEMTHDIIVPIDDRRPTQEQVDAAKSWEYWSWSSGNEINIWHKHVNEALSVLAHETAHSYMGNMYRGFLGQDKMPTDGMSQVQKYGLDEMHDVKEITTQQSAWSEGYAEYWGDRAGANQQDIPNSCDANLEKESTTTPGDYSNKKEWIKTTNSEDMFSSELVNASILRDAAATVPDGTNKIEKLIKQGYSKTLKDFLKKWVDSYPEDADLVSIVVDANTNFSMDDNEFKGIFGEKNIPRRTQFKKDLAGTCPPDSIKKMIESLGKEDDTVSGGCFGDVPLVNGRVPTFLDGMGQIIDGIDDAKENIETIQEGIEAAREVAEIAETLKEQFEAFDEFTGGLAKHTPVINKIFKGVDTLSKVCDITTLLVDGYTALATGDKDAFADMINERVREAVVDVSKNIGSALGEFLGAAGGAAVGGGIASPLTGFLGGWLGGMAGEWLGEQVGGWAYDTFIADWIKKNIADVLFDMMCPSYGGGGEIDPGGPTDPVPDDPNNPNNPTVPPGPGPEIPNPDDPKQPDDIIILPPSHGKPAPVTEPYERVLRRFSK